MDLFFQDRDAASVQAYRDKFNLVALQDDDPVAEGFYLRYRNRCLTLCRGMDKTGIWVQRDEVTRRLKGDFPLGRACGIKRGSNKLVLDMTAGLGIDALALQALGSRLVLLERNEVLWALLRDCLHRLSLPEVMLIHVDARDFARTHYAAGAIDHHAGPVDVVYVDPMFPDEKKTALPAKRMQYVRGCLGDTSSDPEELVALGREIARDRVVLKRRRRDALLGKPDWQIKGNTVRYDVYRGEARSRPQDSLNKA